MVKLLRANRQKMYYALYAGTEPVYELDKNGNKIIDYTDDDGTVYYRETGTDKAYYNTPVLFYASISSNLNELSAREFGVDQSNIYSTISLPKNAQPIKYGTLVWRESEVKYLDDEKTRPDPSSADYTVKGLLTEYLNYDKYLLQRNNKEDE